MAKREREGVWGRKKERVGGGERKRHVWEGRHCDLILWAKDWRTLTTCGLGWRQKPSAAGSGLWAGQFNNSPHRRASMQGQLFLAPVPTWRVAGISSARRGGGGGSEGGEGRTASKLTLARRAGGMAQRGDSGQLEVSGREAERAKKRERVCEGEGEGKGRGQGAAQRWDEPRLVHINLARTLAHRGRVPCRLQGGRRICARLGSRFARLLQATPPDAVLFGAAFGQASGRAAKAPSTRSDRLFRNAAEPLTARWKWPLGHRAPGRRYLRLPPFQLAHLIAAARQRAKFKKHCSSQRGPRHQGQAPPRNNSNQTATSTATEIWQTKNTQHHTTPHHPTPCEQTCHRAAANRFRPRGSAQCPQLCEPAHPQNSALIALCRRRVRRTCQESATAPDYESDDPSICPRALAPLQRRSWAAVILQVPT